MVGGVDLVLDVSHRAQHQDVVGVGDDGAGESDVLRDRSLEEQREEGERRGQPGRGPARGLVLLRHLVGVGVIEDVAGEVRELGLRVLAGGEEDVPHVVLHLLGQVPQDVLLAKHPAAPGRGHLARRPDLVNQALGLADEPVHGGREHPADRPSPVARGLIERRGPGLELAPLVLSSRLEAEQGPELPPHPRLVGSDLEHGLECLGGPRPDRGLAEQLSDRGVAVAGVGLEQPADHLRIVGIAAQRPRVEFHRLVERAEAVLEALEIRAVFEVEHCRIRW